VSAFNTNSSFHDKCVISPPDIYDVVFFVPLNIGKEIPAYQIEPCAHCVFFWREKITAFLLINNCWNFPFNPRSQRQG